MRGRERATLSALCRYHFALSQGERTTGMNERLQTVRMTMCTNIVCTRERVRDLILQAIDGTITGFWHIGYVNDCKHAANNYAHHYCTNDGADCMGIYMND